MVLGRGRAAAGDVGHQVLADPAGQLGHLRGIGDEDGIGVAQQGVAAGRGHARDGTGDGADREVVVARRLGRRERPRAQAGLDDDRGRGQHRDDPVAGEEPPPVGSAPRRLSLTTAPDRATGRSSPGARSGRRGRPRRRARRPWALAREGGPVGRGVDAVGRAADDGEPARRQPVGEVGGHSQAVLGRGPRPHDGDAALDERRRGRGRRGRRRSAAARSAGRGRRASAGRPARAREAVVSHGAAGRRGRARPAAPPSRRASAAGPDAKPRQRLDRAALTQQPGHRGVARLGEEGPGDPSPALVVLEPRRSDAPASRRDQLTAAQHEAGGDVVGRGRCARQVGRGPRDPQHAVVPAQGQPAGVEARSSTAVASGGSRYGGRRST